MTRRFRALALLLALMGCGRELAPGERELAQGLFGETLDTAPVRVVENGFVGVVSRVYPTRPRTTCRERILPPDDSPTITARAAGMVLWNHIHIRPDIARADYARNPDGSMGLVAAMFIAHEMTHVWQWQNRHLTGYSPLRGGAEHFQGDDPYLFDAEANAGFLEYGYEQQASLVEEYICCRVLDPAGARTARLERLLSPVMPVAGLSLPDGVVLPWPEGDMRGICS